MEVGMFQTPFLPPECTPSEVFDWAVDQAITADKAGFSEYWVGEHATLNWEAIPSPELVIAAAARQTSRIKLGPLAHLVRGHAERGQYRLILVMDGERRVIRGNEARFQGRRVGGIVGIGMNGEPHAFCQRHKRAFRARRGNPKGGGHQMFLPALFAHDEHFALE